MACDENPERSLQYDEIGRLPPEAYANAIQEAIDTMVSTLNAMRPTLKAVRVLPEALQREMLTTLASGIHAMTERGWNRPDVLDRSLFRAAVQSGSLNPPEAGA